MTTPNEPHSTDGSLDRYQIVVFTDSGTYAPVDVAYVVEVDDADGFDNLTDGERNTFALLHGTPVHADSKRFVVSHTGFDGDEYVAEYTGTYRFTDDLLIVVGTPRQHSQQGDRTVVYPRERVIRVTEAA